MLCHCLHYILFGTWVIADTENIWNDNSGNNALQCWTIKNIEAQHIFLSLEKREMRKELDHSVSVWWVWLLMVLKGVDDFLLKECMSFDDDTFPPVFSFFHCCLKKVQNKTGSHYKATQVGILPPNFWLENSSFTAPGWCRLLCSCASEQALSWLNSLL